MESLFSLSYQFQELRYFPLNILLNKLFKEISWVQVFHFIYFYFLFYFLIEVYSVQFSRSVMTLCDPMNRSMPGLPVHHQLLESTQTHVHRVGDTIQPFSSSVIPFSSCPQSSCRPFSSCPQSFPASGSFPMSQLFADSLWWVRWPKYWSFSFNISPSCGKSTF